MAQINISCWLLLLHLHLNSLYIRRSRNIWRFSKQTNMSKILEVTWSATYNFIGFIWRQAHKISSASQVSKFRNKIHFRGIRVPRRFWDIWKLNWESRVKSICSNFVVISNDDKITVNHFVVILSSFQIWNDDKITTKWFTEFVVILSSFQIQETLNSLKRRQNYCKTFCSNFVVASNLKPNLT